MTKILSMRELCERTTLSKSAIYRALAASELPKPVQLSARRVGWPETLIDTWIASKSQANVNGGTK